MNDLDHCVQHQRKACEERFSLNAFDLSIHDSFPLRSGPRLPREGEGETFLELGLDALLVMLFLCTFLSSKAERECSMGAMVSSIPPS